MREIVTINLDLCIVSGPVELAYVDKWLTMTDFDI